MSIARGDPDDSAFVPVSTTILGSVAIFISAVLGGTFLVLGPIVGGDLGAAGFWLIVGGGTLGVALIAWDKLTDFFATATPPGREPVTDDEEALGEPVDDLGDVGPD